MSCGEKPSQKGGKKNGKDGRCGGRNEVEWNDFRTMVCKSYNHATETHDSSPWSYLRLFSLMSWNRYWRETIGTESKLLQCISFATPNRSWKLAKPQDGPNMLEWDNKIDHKDFTKLTSNIFKCIGKPIDHD